MLQYEIDAHRVDSRGSVAMCRATTVTLDTSARGREDAMNPGELLLTALAASILKNLEHVAQQISFEFTDAHVEISARRHDSPPRIGSVEYVLTVETEESDRRLALLHTNVRKQGSVYNTLLPSTPIRGIAARATTAPARVEHAVNG